jgi:hypothetical protein
MLILVGIIPLLVFMSGIRKRLTADIGPITDDRRERALSTGGLRMRMSGQRAAQSTPTHSENRHSRSIRARVTSDECAIENATAADTPFTDCMRQNWASGKLSSPQVLEFVNKAMNEFCTSAPPGYQGSANYNKLNKSPDPKNAHRNVVRALGWPMGAPPINWIEVNGKPHPICCPITQWEALAADESAFAAKFGTCSEIKKFWDGMGNHIIYETSKTLIDVENTSPCYLHADGAPTTKHDGLFTISYGSVVAKGSTKFSRNVFTVVKKSGLVDGTLEGLFTYFAWACNALTLGVLPALDWCGKVRADAGRIIGDGVKKLAVIFLKGDWEFFVQVMKFPTWTQVPNMCWICNASPNGALSWCLQAWRHTIRTHQSYVAEQVALGLELPILFNIHTLILEGVLIDTLHAADQGMTSHLVANVFVEVMALGHWGNNQADRCTGLAAALKAWYGQNKWANKIQGKLTYVRIKVSSDWPVLKAKAAATRHITHFALELAIRYDSGSIHDRRRLAVCTLLVRFYEIINHKGMFLPQELRDELESIPKQFFAIYLLLADEALTARIKAWKMVPKFHIFTHLCELQSFINPGFMWCYADEDLQRWVKEVALSCHIDNIEHMVMYKWIIKSI